MNYRPVLFALGLVSAIVREAAAQPPATVDHVDLQRYAGRWYEIARVPNRFQKQCAGDVTAEYELREDGRLDVVNRCTTRDGGLDEARGIAKIEDRSSNARLKVSFVRFLGISVFWGDYWILDLGDDYEYAVVGSPSRKYGWILSRTPTLDWRTLEGILNRLVQQGYEPDAFEMTLH